jgi:hypothetical protein
LFGFRQADSAALVLLPSSGLPSGEARRTSALVLLFRIFQLGCHTSPNVAFLFVFFEHILYFFMQCGIDFFEPCRYILMHRAFAYSERLRCRPDGCFVSDYVLAKSK